MKKVEKRVYHNLEMYQVRIETEIHNIGLGLSVNLSRYLQECNVIIMY